MTWAGRRCSRTKACRWPWPPRSKPRSGRRAAGPGRPSSRGARAPASRPCPRMSAPRFGSPCSPVASPEFRWKSSVQAISRLVLRASCWMPQVGVSPTSKRSKSSCGGAGRPDAGGLRSIRKRMVPGCRWCRGPQRAVGGGRRVRGGRRREERPRGAGRRSGRPTQGIRNRSSVYPSDSMALWMASAPCRNRSPDGIPWDRRSWRSGS